MCFLLYDLYLDIAWPLSPRNHYIVEVVMAIDLFRLYILFSQYKSCDNTQEDWSFVLLVKKSAYKHEYVCMHSF